MTEPLILIQTAEDKRHAELIAALVRIAEALEALAEPEEGRR